MEGELRHLDAEGCDQGCADQIHQRVIHLGLEKLSQIHHIQGTGHRIHHSDTKQVEGSTYRSNQQITECCRDGSLSAKGDQAVAGQGRNLQINIKVKYITRKGHTTQTNRQQSDQCIISARLQPCAVF